MKPQTRQLIGRLQDAASALVFGIVNVTPDSFSDGGRHLQKAAAVAHGLRLADEGADLIDIGGESTRPGAGRPSVDEELERVVPVVADLFARTDCPISVDTSRPEVMRAAVDAGAVMVNDVRGLRVPGALEAVAATEVAVCISHMLGEPDTMQVAPEYDDLVADVSAYLEGRVARCVRAGIAPDAIVLDPGFGFGKVLSHNLELFAALPGLCALGHPVMVGLSRKSMIGAITGRSVDDRLAGSVTAAALAVRSGVRVVRVHDVAATRDALAVFRTLDNTVQGNVQDVGDRVSSKRV